MSIKVDHFQCFPKRFQKKFKDVKNVSAEILGFILGLSCFHLYHRDTLSVGDGHCPRHGDQHKDVEHPKDGGCPRDSNYSED